MISHMNGKPFSIGYQWGRIGVFSMAHSEDHDSDLPTYVVQDVAP